MNLINGVVADSISARDRGLAYGDGVFRTVLLRDGKPLLWQRQYAKLAHDCGALNLGCPTSAACEHDLAQFAATEPDCVVKIIVTRGESTRGYAVPEGTTLTRLVISSPLPAHPVSHQEGGVRVHLCRLRLSAQPALAGVKHLNRLENVLARAEWSDPGIAEGLMCDAGDNVISGTMSNLFIVKDGKLLTPGLTQCGVSGVMRELVIELARAHAVSCEIAAIGIDELLNADEVFVVNSVIGLWPLAALDRKTWVVGKLSGQIQRWIKMLKTLKRWLKRAFWLSAAMVAAFVAWIVFYGGYATQFPAPVQFSLKQGSGLRSAARQMQAAGALNSPWQFEILARLSGHAGRVQAGNYEVRGALSPFALLEMVTSGRQGQDKLTIVEGWTFGQLRAALDAHPALKHDTQSIPEADLIARLGIAYPAAEGWFYPDTYFFPNGASDAALMLRAFRAMQVQLEIQWKTRARGLPLATPYEALILASVIEKETGQPDERPLIASVFVNRLKAGMKLQTDPTVIYGLGAQFDGDLRKRDLLADGPYNTYARTGLPPTPIALPGQAALTAALHPAPGKALYFVARGDGSSYFSNTLAEHERAVTKYQRRGNR